jgi:hypothetical protein
MTSDVSNSLETVFRVDGIIDSARIKKLEKDIMR